MARLTRGYRRSRLSKPVPPPTQPSPASVLDIGPNAGQNHFLLQTSFPGDAAFTARTEAELVAGYTVNPEFVTTPSGTSVQMMVNVAAPTTEGSSFPRSELRELNTDNVTNMAFDPSVGVHYLRGRTKITNLTLVKPTLVVCQAHNASSDIIACCTQLNSGLGVPQLLLRINGSASNIPKPSALYTPGDSFDWQIYFNAGYWAFYYQDMGTPFYDSVAHAANVSRSDPIVYTGSADCYFKCGCYSNTNTSTESGDATQYMQAELRYLSHWHTGWPAADALPSMVTSDQFAPFFA
jgi:hypothetical protein